MTLEERRELVDMAIRWRDMANSPFVRKELAPAFERAANDLDRLLDSVPCGEYYRPVTEVHHLVEVANRELACEGMNPCLCFVECEVCIETRNARQKLRETQHYM